MPFPFEVAFEEIQSNLDACVDAEFGCLESEFLVMPKGDGFVEFPVFEYGYEALKRATGSFREVTSDTVAPCRLRDTDCTDRSSLHSRIHPIGVGLPYEPTYRGQRDSERGAHNRSKHPNEARWGVVEEGKGDGTANSSSRRRRLSRPPVGVPENSPDSIHRLDKADTRAGLISVRSSAELGIPYSMLLYVRLLGRQFAGHRDSISELVGSLVENAIENVLSRAGISFRKTNRAERLPGFDQAPDFVIPNEFNPQVVIEAKLTEDDGTTRDKVTRVQHLGTLSMAGRPADQPRFEVVACIAGRGFGVRREDMKKLLLATRGKVFTLQNVHQLVEHTRLTEFRSR